MAATVGVRRIEVVNAMSVDVEDYFHVNAFDGVVPRANWVKLESRVCRNTERLLALFEASGVTATFFVLGWVAERFPALVSRIAKQGHEIASHGYAHRLIYHQTPDTFRDGLFHYPESGGGPTEPQVSRGNHGVWPDEDWGGSDDIGLIWFDPTATGEDEVGNQGTGMYRYADMGKGTQASMLLQRMGAKRQIKNFIHVPWIFPPRFTYDGAAYVRVNTFEDTAGTKGFVSTVTSAYQAAPYEAAIVLNPHVFTSEIVQPVNSVGSTRWNPTNHMGEWQFVTGAFRWDTDCVDPLEKYGRHFAQFRHAPRPEFPEYGIILIYKRCPTNSFQRVYCT